MEFKYVRDPLFLVCFFAYWINRCLESYGLSPILARSYLNDLICIPFWIPIMLWMQKRIGLRESDEPPRAFELVIPLAIWSLVFEVVLPTTRTWSGLAVPDVNDVVCYALGAAISMRFWEWHYGRSFNGFSLRPPCLCGVPDSGSKNTAETRSSLRRLRPQPNVPTGPAPVGTRFENY